MSNFKKYRLNKDTLQYEVEKKPRLVRWACFIGMILLTMLSALVYFWFFFSFLGWELPKTAVLRKINDRWVSEMEVMNRQMDRYDEVLAGLRIRDDEIYRNIFGMNMVSPAVRNSGLGGANRYGWMEDIRDSSPLRQTTMRLDFQTKEIYVQSKSFDDIYVLSKKAGDRASCIPAISPILTDDTKYRRSSPFGYRTDPITGVRRMHKGFDFACPPGNPIYATGDGKVEKVNFDIFGYGNSIVIDHGFGYETRYAHMKDVYVVEGMKLKRGECIGTTGNSGRSTGPHLHYEVMYMGRWVNPYNFFDLTMPVEEYEAMVRKAEAESPNVINPQKRFKR